MKLLNILLAMVLSLITTIALSNEMNQPEVCIHGICLDRGNNSESELTKKLGDGKKITVGHTVTRCYFSPESRAGIRLGFDTRDKKLRSIFVTKESVCNAKSKFKFRSQDLVTSGGIRLGSDESAVISAYGEPSRIDDAVDREQRNPLYRSTDLSSKYGTRILVYLSKGNDLSTSFFYLKNGKVHSILLSVEE